MKDKDLIQGLIRNDDKTISYIYKEVGPMVLHYVMKIGGSREDANEVFQEGLVAVYENVRTGKYALREDVKFSTYLLQICKYKWYDMTRSVQKTKNVPLEMDFRDNSDVVNEMIRNEKYKKIHALIDKLGKQCKEILRRFYWEDESLEEIGESLGMLPASAKNGKYRCMKKLKEIAGNLR